MNKRLLTEAAFDRYWQMMQPIYTKVIPSFGLEEDLQESLLNTEDIARVLVKFAVETLRKQDRITWFVKRARISILLYLADRVANAPGAIESPKQNAAVKTLVELANKEKQSIINKAETSDAYLTNIELGNDLNEINRTIARVIQYERIDINDLIRVGTSIISGISHFFTQNIPGIQNYTIDNIATPWAKISDDLREIEQDYIKRAGRFIPMDAPGIKPTVIIQYENGAQWLNLNKSYCDLEARAMGHCGNSGSAADYETILSFRTIEKNPITKKKEWIPHLTFILDTTTGYLGEMKGRGNQKPNSKYHGVIVDLLRLPIIKGITGGGYMPENNFTMSDLPREVAEGLMEEKPELANLEFLYKRYGIENEQTIEKIKEILDEYELNHPVGFANDGETVILDQWKDIGALAEGSRDSDFPHVSEKIRMLLFQDDTLTGYVMDYVDSMNNADEIESVIANIPREKRKKLFEFIVDDVDPDFVKKWEVSQNRDLTSDADDLYSFLFDSEGEKEIEEFEPLIVSLRDAVFPGYEAGLNEKIFTEVMQWIESATSDEKPTISPSFIFEDRSKPLDSPIYLSQETDDFIIMLTEELDFLDRHNGEFWLEVFEMEDLDDEIPEPEFDVKAAASFFLDDPGIDLS